MEVEQNPVYAPVVMDEEEKHYEELPVDVDPIDLDTEYEDPIYETVPELNDIQDAYVVAVEEEAKKRLEQLSALHKVKAVDISKVHDFGNNLDNGSLNGNVETNPIYVATSKLTHKSTADDIITDRDNNSIPLTSPTSPSTIESDLTPGSVSIESNLGDADMEMYAMRNGGINGHSNGPVIQDAYASNGSLKDSNMAATQYGNHGNPYALQRSHEHLYESVEDDNEFDGPHREMAIDVPANFVGSKKQKPTFPSNGSRPVSKSQPSTPVKKPFEGDSADSMAKPPDMSHAEKLEHMERIKRYQEDLKKKREEEQRIANEEEFLRTSLRGSKKLQSLEESRLNQRQLQPIHPGFDNPNFEEEALGVDDNITHAATLPVRSHRAGGATKRPIAVEDLFSSLQHIQTKLRSAEDQQDVAFLNKLFHNSRFQQALHIHNKVVEVTMRGGKLPKPTCSNSQELCGDAMNSLNAIAGNPLGEELRVLLQGPNVKALMYSHDKVANQKSEPAKTTTDDDEREYLYERASQYNEDSIKIVRLQKTADPLGATVRNEGESVIVGRIVKGGAAEKSGLLHEGDEILEINGIDIRGKSVNDVCDLMANMTGTLTFLIVPGQDVRKSLLEEEEDADDGVVHLRAHFNYDPEEDIYIPCRELGISFQKGDVLHVINQEDANWWQAYREGEEDQALAGLIPSKSFQEQKEAMKQTIVGDKNESKKKSRCRCGTKSKSKKKKKQLYNASGEEADAEEILTYEEVALYYPQPNRKRPVVLIGPPNVGRHELRQRLMESDVDRFAAAVPHTSRVRKDDEVDLRDYYFVPRHQFEADIALQKFVEYGEYEKNLYGTSLEAIRQVVNSGKICILNLHPQSLRILKASDLKPYVVFVAPPNLENLRMIRHKQGAKISDNELQDIIEKAREMEDSYGHYFDYIIINFDLDKAYDELLSEINRLEVEPQWVPGHWVT